MITKLGGALLADLRWLVPVFHARATSDFLRARTHPRGKQNKYGDGLLCSRKVISPTLRRNLCLPETVLPRKFLVISKYGRKVLPELNARVLGTSSHWCLDRGPRKYKDVQGVVISKVMKEQNTIPVYLFLFS